MAFQFQTGSIKRAETLHHLLLILLSFNSKLVRLKAFYQPSFLTNCQGFNSKLVRLKEEGQHKQYRISYRFNSKLVRLKVYRLQSPSVQQRFNSKLVRLKVVT